MWPAAGAIRPYRGLATLNLHRPLNESFGVESSAHLATEFLQSAALAL
jgi:hypothetical protein